MIKTTFFANNPDDIELTLSLTMTVKEWRAVHKLVLTYGKNTLDAHPYSQLRAAVYDPIVWAMEHFDGTYAEEAT